MHFLCSDWCGLPWTTWQSFSHSQALGELPAAPGVYRVRVVGIEELFYIGETGRNLRERLRSLRTNALQDVMPFNDPHTAGQLLTSFQKSC